MSQRLIKFRVWDITEEKMLVWDDIWYSVVFIPANSFEGQTEEITVPFISICMRDSNKFYPQQFTGLTDKNGREIYEGDIIYFTRENKSQSYTYNSEVIFQDGMFGIVLNNFNDMFVPLKYDNEFTEVLGNIFETPQLIP